MTHRGWIIETAADKPVQSKQDTGEEFPLWVINIDRPECGCGK